MKKGEYMGTIRTMYSIEAAGGRLYRFINEIRQSDIICTEQYCRSDVFHCRIYAADYPKLEEFSRKHGVSIEYSVRPSFNGWLRKFRFRFGIPIGIILCIGILFYFSNTAASIEIRGNSEISERVIRAVLEDSGITEGSWIGSMNFADAEQTLRLTIPDIAWTAIRNQGNRIIVEITEATSKPEMLHERTPCNIVSTEDAQITEVRVYSGHLVRVVGDGVAKGDMIVSGVFEDDKGHVTYHHSLASIRGIYTKEAELSEYFSISNKQYTGRTHEKRWLRIFSFLLPISSGNHGFAEFTENRSDTAFSFLQQTLPFGIVRNTFTETSTEIRIRSEEETRLALNGAIVRYEKNFLSDVEILDREITYYADETGMSCHIHYTVEGEIGKTSDIFIK